jgi:parallel beta-helix repeat protein
MECHNCGINLGGTEVSCEKCSTACDWLPVGTKLFDRFVVKGVLGRGGFGITYAAQEEGSLDREVAIKELFPNGAQRSGLSVVPPSVLGRSVFDTYRQKFLEEGKRLTTLDHPGIVRVHQHFDANGTAYLVMPRLRGETLDTRIRRRGRLQLLEVLALARDLAEPLREVHQGGLLHRDIKPANVFMHEDGRPVLIDFGLARAYIDGESAQLTVMLTPGYAPPEQYSRKARFGPWSDLYALGATVYEALTGARPPDGNDRALDNEPLRFPEGTPASLIAALEGALKPRYQARPQDVEEFLAVLDLRPRAMPIDLEALAARTDGDLVVLPPGDVAIDKTITVTGDLRLLGAGMGKTRLLVTAPVAGLLVNSTGRLTMSDLSVECRGKEAVNLVDVEGEVTLTNCRVTGAARPAEATFGGAGIRFDGEGKGLVGSCVLSQNTLHGIDARGRAHPTLDGNIARGNEQGGIVYFEDAAGIAQANTCETNGLQGIEVQDRAHPTLDGNIARGNKQSGIRYGDDSEVIARANICEANELSGIIVVKSAHPTLDGNIARGNKQAGIVYAGDAEGIAGANVCESNEFSGISVQDRAHPTLDGNVVRGNMQSGIIYFGDTAGIARANTCEANEKNGIALQGRAHPTLDGNIARNNKPYQIAYLESAAGVARNNAMSWNRRDPPLYVADTAKPDWE